MLYKNIYILYPPGYCGSYLSWCLYKSNKYYANNTIDNPINLQSNEKYGGLGTSHLHHRIPTHSNIHQIIAWIILNKPLEKKIYLVNFHDEGMLGYSIDHILNFDRDPFFIHITANTDYEANLANLNAYTKWPLYFKVAELDKLCNINLDIDIGLELRNKLFINFNKFFPRSKTINFNSEFRYEHNFTNFRRQYKLWYDLRNKHNWHEVNENYYSVPVQQPKNFIEVSLEKLLSNDFFQTFSKIFTDNEVGEFDFSFATNFHKTYIDAQVNIQVLNKLIKMCNDKKLCEDVFVNPLVETIALKMFFPNFGSEHEHMSTIDLLKFLVDKKYEIC